MKRTITIDVNPDEQSNNKFIVQLEVDDPNLNLTLDHYYLNDAIKTAEVLAREHRIGYAITYEAIETNRQRN